MPSTTSTNRPTLMQRLFFNHPATVGESYGTHFLFALRFSARLMKAAGAALLHALVPAVCEHTASQEIRKLHAELTARSGHS